MGPARDRGRRPARDGLGADRRLLQGLYFTMASGGAILADDGVVERFVFADSWRIFLERFALGRGRQGVIPEVAALREPLRGRGQGAGAGPWRPARPSDRTRVVLDERRPGNLVDARLHLEVLRVPLYPLRGRPAVIEQALVWIQARSS